MRDCIKKYNNEFKDEIREDIKELNRWRNMWFGGAVVLYILITQVPTVYNWFSATGTAP